MTCKECLEQLSPYIDNELSLSKSRELKIHLMSCETCHEEYILLKTIVDHMGSWDEIHLPNSFHNDLMSQVKKESATKKTYPWVHIGASLAAVLLIYFGFMLNPYFKTNKTKPAQPMPAVQTVNEIENEIENTAKPSTYARMASEPPMQEAFTIEIWKVNAQDQNALTQFLYDSKELYNYSLQEDSVTRNKYILTFSSDSDKQKLSKALESISESFTVVESLDSLEIELIIQ